MNDTLKEKLKYLRLTGLLAHWELHLEKAQHTNFSHVRWLEYIIDEEVLFKKENARKCRMSRAKIPEKLVMETFPFSQQPNLSKKKLLNLYDAFDYLLKNQNIIWIGPTGTGKSGLATAFLIQAINQGYNGRFILFSELIELLYQSIADHSQHKVIKAFAAYDCLLIDELGYSEMEPVQVGLFFTLMHKRHQRKSTLITSNLGFSQWSDFLKNEQLTAALIDRVTENSHIINMKNCISLRAKLSS
jgi:DNA replication protein DnaC